MAFAHHDAANRHERRGGKAKLFGTQQSGDDDITAGLKFAVGLHTDPAAQVVQHKNLLRFRQPEFPRYACML